MQAHLHSLLRSHSIESLNAIADTLRQYHALQKQLHNYYELHHIFNSHKIQDLQQLVTQENVHLTKLQQYYRTLARPLPRCSQLIPQAYPGFHLSALRRRSLIKKLASLITVLSHKIETALVEDKALNAGFLHQGMSVESFIERKKKNHLFVQEQVSALVKNNLHQWKSVGQKVKEHSREVHTKLERSYQLLAHQLMKLTDKTSTAIKKTILDTPFVVHQQGVITLRKFLAFNQWIYQTGVLLASVDHIPPQQMIQKLAALYAYVTHFKLDHLLQIYAQAQHVDLTTWQQELFRDTHHPIKNGRLLLALDELSLAMNQYVKQSYPLELVCMVGSLIQQSPYTNPQQHLD